MPKTKAKNNEVVTFEVGIKGRKPIEVQADQWQFPGYANAPMTFLLRGELVLAVQQYKWEYARRTNAVKDGS